MITRRFAVDRGELLAACKTYGPVLKLAMCAPVLGKPLDGATLLWALSGNESDFGANCIPRFEPAYFSGRYAKDQTQAHMNGLYGEDAAKSYGPWQLMLINAPGFTPYELRDELEKAATATVGFINRVILGRQAATTLEEIADSYNSGNFRDQNIPIEYIAKLEANYGKGLPET